MRYPDLSRFDDDRLESILRSYRRLSSEHIEAGHWALGVWATKMATHVTIELNKRAMAKETALKAQMNLYDESSSSA